MHVRVIFGLKLIRIRYLRIGRIFRAFERSLSLQLDGVLHATEININARVIVWRFGQPGVVVSIFAAGCGQLRRPTQRRLPRRNQRDDAVEGFGYAQRHLEPALPPPNADPRRRCRRNPVPPLAVAPMASIWCNPVDYAWCIRTCAGS